MPIYGVNPLNPPKNTRATGTYIGSSKRYFSKDVVRLNGERVKEDKFQIPNVPLKRLKPFTNEEIEGSLGNDPNSQYDPTKKLKFVSTSYIQCSDGKTGGLMTLDEYKTFKKKGERKSELLALGLDSVCSHAIIGIWHRRQSTKCCEKKDTRLNQKKMSNLIYQKSLKVCFTLSESFGIEEENECDLDTLIEQKKREQEAKNRMFSIIL